MPALELQDVRKTYGSGDTEVVALDHASLAVEGDEMVALIGPSGSGKTTLLSIAGGLLAPTDGSVRVGPHEISGYDRKQLTRFRREFVGFVFQGANLVPFLTAKENLLVVADLAGNRGRSAERRALTLLEELGLGHRVDNLPGQLSGGERQRVAIGRALMNEPELVLFDEPTSALDSALGEQVMELIRSEVKGRGTAAVVVTHDTRMTPFADRIVEISDGRLVA
jgi:putative ABC transport system ATP-binding protein